MRKFIGIDYSLTSPAIAIIDESGKIFVRSLNSVKKYSGNYQYENLSIEIIHLDKTQYSHEIERYSYIADNLLKGIEFNPEDLVAIEGYSMGSKGKVFHIAENTCVLKFKLWCRGVDYKIVEPTTLKQFATGKGNSKKFQMYDSLKIDFLSKFEAFTKNGKKSILNPKEKSPVSDIVDAIWIAKWLDKN